MNYSSVMFILLQFFCTKYFVLATDTITTIAGNSTSGSYSGDNGLAINAGLNYPAGVTVDSSGNVYIADESNNRIRKITEATGIITTVAGIGTASYSGDNGLATSATLYNPAGITLDTSGNFYVADTVNCRIRKVTVSTGIIMTVAGIGTAGYSGDNGQATSAALWSPYRVSLDTSADTYNHCIRKVTVSTGIITTIAGTGASSYSGDNGPATSATLDLPFGLSLDLSGNIYVADTHNHCIRKVTVTTGIITTVAGIGTGTNSYSGDGGAATSATLNYPYGLTLDSSGNIYIADTQNSRIRKVIVSTGIIATVAGIGTGSYSGDNGPATSASLYAPVGIALDSAGNMYIADYANHKIRKITVSSSALTPSMAPSVSPAASPASSTDIIVTVAGCGSQGYSGDNAQATSAELYYPEGLSIDMSGNMYIADSWNHRIRKVTVSTGIITTIAGTGSQGYSGDGGDATNALLNYPQGVTTDASGNVYIADEWNLRIRKVTVATGIITTIAGTGGTGSYSGDGGDATSASLNRPYGIAVDTSGNSFVADTYNNRIRKVTVATGIITTIAGSSTSGSYSGDDGPATSATLNYPYCAVLDESGNVYIADITNNRIRKVTVSTGIITTIAGSSTSGSYSGDNGPATSAMLHQPRGVSLDTSGNVYIADTANNRIRKVTVSTGIITTIAGSSTSGSYSGDNGPATSATMNIPSGLAIDTTGTMYICDWGNNRIRKVTATSSAPSMTPTTLLSTTITTIAGSGTSSFSGDGGAATSATLNTPVTVELDISGNVYIADSANHRIRKLTISTGIITTIAGGDGGGVLGDNGPATSAGINYPWDIAFDTSGNLYIADSNNNRIRKVTVSTGIISTVAGSSTSTGYSGDNGQATSAMLYYPQANILDSSGNIYITDSGNNRVRKVTVSTGIITTVVGTGTAGYSGDDGQATSAALHNPCGITFDIPGNIYIADYGNHCIRKVTVSTGIITTIAGTGSQGYSGDGGEATSAKFDSPRGISLDTSGNVYIADSRNNRVRKVTVSTGIIITIAGTGTNSYSGDGGDATSASLANPEGIALDSSGNLYIADSQNQRVRKVTLPSTEYPTAAPSTSSPTYTPSALPTLTPSPPPSSHPTASPSHGSPSDIYLMTHQIMEGLSALDYNSNRSLSDSILETAIAQSLKQGITRSAITVNSVGDHNHIVSSRSLTLSGAKILEIQYTIQCSTQRWVDDTQGIAVIIKALNSSIVDGSFDAYLHSTPWASNPFINATTMSIAFYTAAPTSTPTSAPTQLDVVAANVFDTGLSSEVVKGKTDYYLGSFTGYFVVIFVLLWILELVGFGQQTVRRLHDSACSTAVFNKAAVPSSNDEAGQVNDDPFSVLHRLNHDLNRTVERQTEREKSVRGRANLDDTRASSFASRLIKSQRTYPDVMYKYIRQRRTLLGCQSLLYPNGYNQRIGCFHYHAPKSKIEDLLVYICNNHTVFSCLYSAEGERLGHMGRRIVYITKDCISFFLSQMAFTILQFVGVAGSNYIRIGFMILITPSISRISQGIVIYMYTLPFLERDINFEAQYPVVHCILKFTGKLAVLPILVLIFGLLVFACLFTSGRDIPMVLVTYFFNVQVYSLLLELFIIYLAFVDDYYFALNVKLRGKAHTLLSVGSRYAELIVYHNLVRNKDYIMRKVSLCSVITIHTIINREVAIKAGILQKKTIEMINSQTSSMKASANRQVGTALNAVESIWDYFTRKHVVYFEDDEVGEDDIPTEDVGHRCNNYINTTATASYHNCYKEYAPIDTKPGHSTDNAIISASLSRVEAHNFSMDIIYGDDDTDADTMNYEMEDITLVPREVLVKQYLEETQIQVKEDTQKIDLSGLSEEAVDEILFEEWKSKKQKKCNKKETRRSFIKAYNIFENLFGLGRPEKSSVNKSERQSSTLASTVNPLLANRET